MPLPGRTIERAQILWPRTLAEPTLEELHQRLPGQAVAGVGRRGKFAIVQLSRDALLIHLRMSGDLRVEPGTDKRGQALPLQPHDRAVFYFDEGLRLAFNDARKFGRIWLVADARVILQKLGPEPQDPALTPDDFYRSLQLHHRRLKPLLLDQTFIAGLGNIYTDEALYLAGLHPNLISSSLTYEQAERLLQAVRSVLAEGIRTQGASIDWVYRGGDFQNHFRVYQRAGDPCPVCGTPVQRIVVGQRGTHFCPVCQPDPAENLPEA
jgi:formamidopyrimidine-DNA glycosylase